MSIKVALSRKYVKQRRKTLMEPNLYTDELRRAFRKNRNRGSICLIFTAEYRRVILKMKGLREVSEGGLRLIHN